MLPRAARLHLQTDVQTEQLANPMTPRRAAFHWLDRLAASAAAWVPVFIYISLCATSRLSGRRIGVGFSGAVVAGDVP